MAKKLLAIVVCVFLASCAHERAPQANDLSVTSPDSAISLKLTQDDGRLNYEITSHFAPIIEPSHFVFTIDGDNIADASTFAKTERYSGNSTYPTRGVHSLAVDHYNGARFTLRHKTRDYVLDIRAFNDAVAFRFIAPGDPSEQRTPDELTTFILPVESTIWSHDLNGHYEGTPEKKLLVAVKEDEWAAPPLTIKLPRKDGYAAITEANLFDYAGMALQANEHHGYTIGLGHRQPVSHPYELSYSKEDIERLSHPAVISGTITTPWRVVLIGKTLDALVNSDAITNLCLPADAKLFPQGLRGSIPMLVDVRRGGTRAARIATPIITTSPLLTFAANPRAILSNPADDFIESIPSTWDQTIVLPPSEIGEIAVFARRSRATWFLAVVNGSEPRHVEIPLTFLRPGDHSALLVEEEPLNTSAVRVQHAVMRPFDKITLDLPAGGGFAGRFLP